MKLWIAVAAFIAVAVVFLLVPLWRRRSPGERLRWPTAGVLGVLPVATVLLYLYLGAPTIIDEQRLFAAQAARDADAMLAALEDRLRKVPNDAEGWYVLGRAYIALQRHAEAEKALAKAVELAPDQAKMLAQYAEALALQSGSLLGRPHELVMQAIELDYEEEKALELAGLAAWQQEKYAEALHFWRRLLKKLPRESELYETISQAVKLAEERVALGSGLGERAKLIAPVKQGWPH